MFSKGNQQISWGFKSWGFKSAILKFMKFWNILNIFIFGLGLGIELALESRWQRPPGIRKTVTYGKYRQGWQRPLGMTKTARDGKERQGWQGAFTKGNIAQAQPITLATKYGYITSNTCMQQPLDISPKSVVECWQTFDNSHANIQYFYLQLFIFSCKRR